MQQPIRTLDTNDYHTRCSQSERRTQTFTICGVANQYTEPRRIYMELLRRLVVALPLDIPLSTALAVVRLASSSVVKVRLIV
jgi:hypothetical protein